MVLVFELAGSMPNAGESGKGKGRGCYWSDKEGAGGEGPTHTRPGPASAAMTSCSTLRLAGL